MFGIEVKTSAELAEEFGIPDEHLADFDSVVTIFNVTSVMATHSRALEIAPDQGIEVESLGELISSGRGVSFSGQDFDRVFNGVVAEMNTKVDGFVSLPDGYKDQTKELFGSLEDGQKRRVFENAINAHSAVNLKYITLEY